MSFSYLSQFNSFTMAPVLFLAMLLTYWAGLSFARRVKHLDPADGFGPVQGSLLGLLALLLAFTFSMSAGRFDARRHVLIEEANDIGTTILRADLYPDAERQLFRADLRDYVEARIAFHEAGMDTEKVNATTRLSSLIAEKIWQRAARLAQDPNTLIPSSQMIPAINAMIDVVTTRNATRQSTVPDSILWMLFLLCLLGSFLVGFSSTKLSWAVGPVFALMISACVFIIIDLDRPSQGFITLDAANQHIVELREMFPHGN